MLHISIKAEPLFYIGNFAVTNSYLTSVIVIILFALTAIYYYAQLQAKSKSLFFYFLHFCISGIYSLFNGITKEKTHVFFPLVAAFFFYILLQNWFGLLPGVGSILIKSPAHQTANNERQALKEEKTTEVEKVPILRAAAADLNTTIALGILAVVLIQYYGIKYLGFKEYIQKFINFTNPINFVLGLLEIISEISRVLSFAFRLFGNIFAGEVLLGVITFLIPVLASYPFWMMEIFVGFIQALVFAMLFAVLLQSSTISHSHH